MDADIQLVLGERIDLRRDWADDLAALDGTPDTLTGSTWAVVDEGLTVETDPAPSFDDTSATVWVSGGSVHRTYRLRNTVTTAGGRRFVDVVTVQVVRSRRC